MSESDGITGWRYVKIYLEPAQQDELLIEHLRPWATASPRLWFFVRYSDDEALTSGHHLRLRFRGPEGEWDALLALVTKAAGRIASRLPRVVPASYEPEIDRYGGVDGLAIVHQIFTEDSANVLRISATPERSDLVWLASADDFLTALACGEDHRRAAYERQTRWVLERLYDSEGDRTRVLAKGQAVLDKITPRLAAAHHVLLGERSYQKGRRTLTELGAQLARVERDGCLTRSVVEILVDLQHMHFNRVGISPRKECSAALLLGTMALRVDGRYA